MIKIILDTNFLLIPAQFNVDIFSEIRRIAEDRYRLFIVDKTLDELDNIIALQKGKHKSAAMLAKSIAAKLIKSGELNIIKTGKTERLLNVDDLILKMANSCDYAVATQDVALKRKLRQNNVALIVLRQKKYLEMQKCFTKQN